MGCICLSDEFAWSTRAENSVVFQWYDGVFMMSDERCAFDGVITLVAFSISPLSFGQEYE
jgi:hypothetical protein